jgi:hypothetical protein
MTEKPASEVVEAEGHLIDSQLLNLIFDKVIERGGSFEVQHFDIGRTNVDMSHLRLQVTAANPAALQRLIEELMPLGCHPMRERDADVEPADKDGCAPVAFYSTTNQQTSVRYRGRWIDVDEQRMDAVIVIDDGRAVCRKLGRRQATWSCAASTASAWSLSSAARSPRLCVHDERHIVGRRVEVSVGKIAKMMREVRAGGGGCVCRRPVVIHTGGVGTPAS